jgi:RecB family exonuclease
LTRDGLYDHLHAGLPNTQRRLTPLERDVLAQAAARVAGLETPLSFQLRPGLVAEALRFYDHLRRQSRRIDRFEELIGDGLAGDELERGAERLRRQTRFLAGMFREYERLVRASNGWDEHLFRERLLLEAAPDPIRHVIVTVADWIADADGLFVADFDLLARLSGLESLDIVATETLLRSGFHERLHNWWPGIEESHHAASLRPAPPLRPVLVTPPGASAEEPWWTHRDREEELVAIARHLKADRRRGEAAPLDRTAVVFKRPLPYLYLVADVFGSAGIPYQTTDGFPLAAEPTAAAIDVMLETVASNFTRDSLVALLRSPHFVFEDPARGVNGDLQDGDPQAGEKGGKPDGEMDDETGREISAATSGGVTGAATAGLDRALSDARYLGDHERLAELLPAMLETLEPASPVRPALRAALALARELAPLAGPAPASVQVRRALAFWQAHARPIAGTGPVASREHRARAAVVGTLTALASVHAEHDDPLWTVEDLALAFRRWIEEQTFESESGGRGVKLLDDRAARYGDFHDIVIVGVVESDWPERPRRNIFYPAAVLKALGWPSEKDRRAADDAHFLDLLASASRRTSVSVFTLEDDALVSRSMQLDELPRANLALVGRGSSEQARVFVDEALSLEPVTMAPLAPGERVWAQMRASRSEGNTGRRFHGSIGALPERTWSISALETYLGCPFRFFAQHVLKLDEALDDEEVMAPKRQGQLVHEIFERFFREWQRAGNGAVTPDNLEQARTLFTDVVDRTLEDRQLPHAEAGLERTRLLGSPAAAGLGEAVLRMEAGRSTPVFERLLEHDLRGEFSFRAGDGLRTIPLRGKADRLDLLADGTFRVIDYKLGWPPDRNRALQLPIYSLCAEQRLSGYRDRRWTLGEAAYLAFKGPKRVVPLFKNAAERDDVLSKAQQRLVETVDRIGAGDFPPTPDDVFRCESCSYGSVCRKDYVGDV